MKQPEESQSEGNQAGIRSPFLGENPTTGKGASALFGHPKMILCLALAVTVLAVYWPVQYHGFNDFDDEQYVVSNPKVRAGLTLDGLIWAFSFNKEFYWHPLTWLSHMLDCQLYGINPQGHHLNNMLLHAANTLLLFLFLKGVTGTLWRSAAVALLFAIHPLNVESVAWLASRKNLLSTFFGMLALLAYCRYSGSSSLGWYASHLLFFTLSLMAKPMFVTLPLVLLVLDYWPLRRLGEDCRFKPRVVLEKAPLLLISLFSVAVGIASGRSNDLLISPAALPLALRIENGVVSYIQYISKTFWPSQLTLFYPYPASIANWKSAVCGLALAAATLFFIRNKRRIPFLLAGWAWYIITLLPVIGIVQQGLWPGWADRFAYTPLIGIFIMIVWGRSAIGSRAKWLEKTSLSLFLAAIVALVWCTSKQVDHWGSAEVLWTRAVNFTPPDRLGYIVPLHNLATIKIRKGELEEASLLYTRSLDLYPNNPDAHNSLGSLLARRGKNREAIEHLLTAIRINPGCAAAYNNLANILVQEGRLEEALEHYSVALRIDPQFKEAQYNLDRALAKRQVNENQRRESLSP